LFSEEEKSKNIIGISKAVQAGKLKEHEHLVQCPKFSSLLKEAIAAPDGKAAIEVMKTILPILNLSKPISDFGPSQRTQCIACQIACHRRFGPAATFVTLAPNLQDDPTALRATFRSTNNDNFPANIDDNYIEALKNDSSVIGEGNISLPVGYKQRAKRASDNPVAMAAEYQNLINNVLEILFGIPPDTCTMGTGRKTNRTCYYKYKFGYKGNKFRSKGIFGYIFAYYGTHEAQHRGTLHFHVILYGGISPEILDAVGGMNNLCASVSAVLDQMYKAELSPSFHLTRLFKNYQRTNDDLSTSIKTTRHAMVTPSFHNEPLPNQTKKWHEFTQGVVVKCGVHRHTFTCRKSFCKHTKCRESYKQRPVQFTRPMLLSQHPQEVYISKNLKCDEYPPIATAEIPFKKKSRLRNKQLDPLTCPDEDRCIYWDIQRRQIHDLPDLSELNPSDKTTKRKCISAISVVLQPKKGFNSSEKKLS